MNAEPQKQHQWLSKLVGEWTMEMEADMPGQGPSKSTGFERVRSLGGMWVIMEGEMPGEKCPMQSVLTLGYDPDRKTFVGTFIASVMTYLWVYQNGTLDEAERVLTLEAEGPNFAPGGPPMSKYRDVIEFHSDDHRTLSSFTPDPDGQWKKFMTAHYRRKK